MIGTYLSDYYKTENFNEIKKNNEEVLQKRNSKIFNDNDRKNNHLEICNIEFSDIYNI